MTDKKVISVVQEPNGTWYADATWLPGSPPVARDLVSKEQALDALRSIIRSDEDYAKYWPDDLEATVVVTLAKQPEVASNVKRGVEFEIEEMPQGALIKRIDSGDTILISSPDDARMIIESLGRMLETFPIEANDIRDRIMMQAQAGAFKSGHPQTLIDSLARLVNEAMTYPSGDLRGLAEEVRREINGS